MPITLNLPEPVEQAFEAEARIHGLSTSEFLQTLLLEHLPASNLAHEAATQWTRKDGIPVLESALPFPAALIEDTLEQVRREREFTILGLPQK